MPAYLKWLQFLATFSDDEIAQFNALELEVITEGDRLIWKCSDAALKSEAIEPILHLIPKIIEHNFRQFEMHVDGRHILTFEFQHLRGMAREL